MSMDQVINLLAMVTLVQMMVTIGLGVTTAQVIAVAKDRPTVIRAALANYVVVPAVAVLLLLAFQATPMVAVGFLIAAVCPGAPYGPPFAALARANVSQAVGLMVILAGSSAVLAPVLLGLLLPIVAGDEPVHIDALKVLTTLALCQFLPLCAGLYLKQKHPLRADALTAPFKKLSTALNLALLTMIFVSQFQLLMEIRLRGYVGMLALLSASLIAGYLISGPGTANRRTLAITTGIRNVGVTLAIASSSFPGSAAVTAATAYGLFQTLAVALLAAAWGRMASRG